MGSGWNGDLKLLWYTKHWPVSLILYLTTDTDTMPVKDFSMSRTTKYYVDKLRNIIQGVINELRNSAPRLTFDSVQLHISAAH
jgi:hypothetical protein